MPHKRAYFSAGRWTRDHWARWKRDQYYVQLSKTLVSTDSDNAMSVSKKSPHATSAVNSENATSVTIDINSNDVFPPLSGTRNWYDLSSVADCNFEQAQQPAKTPAEEEEVGASENAMAALAELKQEREKLYQDNVALALRISAYQDQLQHAEYALGVWMAHADSLSRSDASFNHDMSLGDFSWDESRVGGIERAVSEQAIALTKFEKIIADHRDQLHNHQNIDLLEEVTSLLSSYQQSANTTVSKLVKSLEAAVQSQMQNQFGNLQQQIDYIKEKSIPSFEDDTDKWYDATSLQALVIPATDVIIAVSTGEDILRSEGSWAKSPGQDEGDAVCDQLHTNNVVLKRPVQREGGNDAGCDQLQNNVVGDRPVQRDHDRNDAGCDQLQNNVVDDRPVQRDGGKGNAECHQLQCSHPSLVTHLSNETLSVIDHFQYDWLSLRPVTLSDYLFSHAASVKDKSSKACLTHDGKAFEKPASASGLSPEEEAVTRMTDTEFERKMQADRDLLQSLYGAKFDDEYEQVEVAPSLGDECCPGGHYNDDECWQGMEVAPSYNDECCPDTAQAPHLGIGSRVTLCNLERERLVGMVGMVASAFDSSGRCKVLLEDGTTRKFERQHLKQFHGGLSSNTCGSQSHHDSSAALCEKVGGESDFDSRSRDRD